MLFPRAAGSLLTSALLCSVGISVPRFPAPVVAVVLLLVIVFLVVVVAIVVMVVVVAIVVMVVVVVAAAIVAMVVVVLKWDESTVQAGKHRHKLKVVARRVAELVCRCRVRDEGMAREIENGCERVVCAT